MTSESPQNHVPAPSLPEKLWDCSRHFPEPGSELIIAEGDSAAEALLRDRDNEWQAILAVQGKPMNAWKASASRVESNVQLLTVRDSIGAGWGDDFDLDSRRYERLILLFDPDVDGVHSRALMLLFLYRWMRPLLEAGVVYTGRPPLWEFKGESLQTVGYAYNDEQVDDVLAKLRENRVAVKEQERFRGLASMSEDTMERTCLNPKTRKLSPLTAEHAEGVIATYERLAP